MVSHPLAFLSLTIRKYKVQNDRMTHITFVSVLPFYVLNFSFLLPLN